MASGDEMSFFNGAPSGALARQIGLPSTNS
jgi:hypothetical protein